MRRHERGRRRRRETRLRDARMGVFGSSEPGRGRPRALRCAAAAGASMQAVRAGCGGREFYLAPAASLTGLCAVWRARDGTSTAWIRDARGEHVCSACRTRCAPAAVNPDNAAYLLTVRHTSRPVCANERRSGARCRRLVCGVRRTSRQRYYAACGPWCARSATTDNSRRRGMPPHDSHIPAGTMRSTHCAA